MFHNIYKYDSLFQPSYNFKMVPILCQEAAGDDDDLCIVADNIDEVLEQRCMLLESLT